MSEDFWTKEEWQEHKKHLFLRTPLNNELPVKTQWVRSPTVGRIYKIPIRAYFKDAGFSQRQSDHLALALVALFRAKYPTKKMTIEDDGKYIIIGPYRMDETLFKTFRRFKGLLFEFYKFVVKTHKEGE